MEAKNPDASKAAALDEIVPLNPNKPYDIKEVIDGIVDQGSFYEVHKDYADNIVVGFARLDQLRGPFSRVPLLVAWRKAVTPCTRPGSRPKRRAGRGRTSGRRYVNVSFFLFLQICHPTFFFFNILFHDLFLYLGKTIGEPD